MPGPDSQPTFFSSVEAFRSWLARHHASASELWVGFHRKHTGKPSLTWPGSVDAALAFGWIDGIRKSLDGDAYMIRFTPRKRGSVWSNVNIRKAEALIRDGLMHPAGLRAFEAREAKKSGIYSFEQPTAARLSAAELKQFRAEVKAWKFFQAQPPGYRRLATHWVVTAKRPETRERRLRILIADSGAGERIGPLRRPNRRSHDASPGEQ
jgi:uncharacterized protein YdeI (YjbR/CyaY-like superfamily)